MNQRKTYRGTRWVVAVLGITASCGGTTSNPQGRADAGDTAPARPDADTARLPADAIDTASPSPDVADTASQRADALDTGTSPIDAGDTATSPIDAGDTATSPLDVSDTNDSPPDIPAEAPAAACAKPLSGSAPFGMMLSGSGSFASSFASSGKSPITSTMNAHIYFPAGRVAGAPVQLAIQSRVVSGQYFFGPQVKLAADLSATGLTVGGHDMDIFADLLPGTGGLHATINANFSSPSTDVADDRSATMVMCPAGDVPAPALQVTGTTLSPLSGLTVNTTTPIALDAMKALRITSPVGNVAFTLSADSWSSTRFSGGPNFTLSGAPAFPPGQPLSFDASALKDVLGRPVPISAGAQVLVTSAVLSDLSFASSPPAGAVAASGCTPGTFSVDAGAGTEMATCTGGGTVANGVLKVSSSVPTGGLNVDALLALPATSATKLRVRMAVGAVVDAGTSCSSGFSYASMKKGIVAVVGPHGEASPALSLACDGTMADHVFDLPAASPLWLVVHVEGYASAPFFSPMPGPPSFSIDELAFM